MRCLVGPGRRWTLALVGACLAFWLATASLAGDPPPAGKVSSTLLPERFLMKRPKATDLNPGESGRAQPGTVRVTPDGVGWVNLSAFVFPTSADPPAGTFSRSLKVVRVDAKSFDVNLTGTESVWGLVMREGGEFVPTAEYARVRQFTEAYEHPSDVLPAKYRGRRLWSLPPDTVVYLSANCFGCDARGETWIDPGWAARDERFEDGAGPAVIVTTTDRDAVRIDVTGVTHRWLAEPFPESKQLKGEVGLEGHRTTPFAVSSVTRDGAKTTRMPPELLCPMLKDLKSGQGGYVDSFSVRIDANGVTWLDPEAVVEPSPHEGDWGFGMVRIELLDAASCSLDLCTTTARWCAADHLGHRFPTTLDQGNIAFGQTWLRAARIRDGAEDLGAAMPARCRQERVFEITTKEPVYTSCRYVVVDAKRNGVLPGWAPVSRAPFTDDLGPAVAVRLADDDLNCTVDLAGATHRWDTGKTLQPELIDEPKPGGPRAVYLRIAQFLVDAPPAPPPPPAKPPKKK